MANQTRKSRHQERRFRPFDADRLPPPRRYLRNINPPIFDGKIHRGKIVAQLDIIPLSRRYFQKPPPVQILSGKIKRWRTIKEDFQPADSSPAVVLPESIYAGLFEKFVLFDNG